jgi:hypothetical protein
MCFLEFTSKVWRKQTQLHYTICAFSRNERTSGRLLSIAPRLIEYCACALRIVIPKQVRLAVISAWEMLSIVYSFFAFIWMQFSVLLLVQKFDENAYFWKLLELLLFLPSKSDCCEQSQASGKFHNGHTDSHDFASCPLLVSCEFFFIQKLLIRNNQPKTTAQMVSQGIPSVFRFPALYRRLRKTGKQFKASKTFQKPCHQAIL